MNISFFKTDGDKERDFVRLSIIIHSFALIHALTCFTLRSFIFNDGLFLTILTIGMIAVLVNFFNGNTEIFLAMAFLACLAGFYLGVEGARLISLFIKNDLLTHTILTAFITESLGWSVVTIIRKRRSK